MSIDKQVIVDTVTRMGELPARTYLPPDGTLSDFRWLPGPYDRAHAKDQPYDPADVRALLEQPPAHAGPGLPYDVAEGAPTPGRSRLPQWTGLPNAANPLQFRFHRAKQIVQVLKNQWKQALNIDVDIQTVEGKIYKQRVSKKDYVIGCAAWYGDYPDASTFTDKYLSDSLQNDSDWQNKKFDKLCYDATKQADMPKRIATPERGGEPDRHRSADRPAVSLRQREPQPRQCARRDAQPAKRNDLQGRVGGEEVGGGRPTTGSRLDRMSAPRRLLEIMSKVILWRIAQFPLILTVIYLITFLLAWVAPGDPFVNERNMDPIVVASLRQRYHASSAIQFLAWYPYNILRHGDFGPSMQYREWTVNDIIGSALPVSVTLGVFSLAIAVLVGVGVGTHRRREPRRGSGLGEPHHRADRHQPPELCHRRASVNVGGGDENPSGRRVGRVLQHDSSRLCPVAVADGVHRSAHARRMLDTLGADFVRTARAKGLAAPWSSGSIACATRSCRCSATSARPRRLP